MVLHSRPSNRGCHGAERGHLRAVRKHFSGRALAPAFPGPGPQVRACAQILRSPVKRRRPPVMTMTDTCSASFVEPLHHYPESQPGHRRYQVTHAPFLAAISGLILLSEGLDRRGSLMLRLRWGVGSAA